MKSQPTEEEVLLYIDSLVDMELSHFNYKTALLTQFGFKYKEASQWMVRWHQYRASRDKITNMLMGKDDENEN